MKVRSPQSIELSPDKVIQKLGVSQETVAPPKFKPFTVAEKANILKVKASELKAPVTLSPATPTTGEHRLVFDSCISTAPFFPSGSGDARFNSLYHGEIGIPNYKKLVVYKYRPGVRVYFPTLKSSDHQKYLIEYHLGLHTYKANYSFEQGPSGQVVTLAGPSGFGAKAASVSVVIDDPIVSESSLHHDNPATESAQWSLYSVIITPM